MSDLVCYCYRVPRAMILKAIDQGSLSVEDLSRSLGACMGCGGCREDLESLLRFSAEERRLLGCHPP